VSLGRGAVRLVGECKWTSRRMGVQILEDLDAYKLPALRQDGERLAEYLGLREKDTILCVKRLL
jgi:hypothetical protein